MVGVGFFRGPGVPYLGTFCETNVRRYSVDPLGRRGVVFLSLDAARLLPVLVARAGLRLPYMWSHMRLHRAELLSLSDTLVPATGLPAFTRPPDSVLYSPGVPVTFGRPDTVRP